jgi:hypothetical protein
MSQRENYQYIGEYQSHIVAGSVQIQGVVLFFQLMQSLSCHVDKYTDISVFIFDTLKGNACIVKVPIDAVFLF